MQTPGIKVALEPGSTDEPDTTLPLCSPLDFPRWVIQDHTPRTHHFDLRLETDGVFKSYAIPDRLGLNRLPIHVEDHDPTFGSFQGTTSEGEQGLGSIEIGDAGTYESPQLPC